MKKINWYKLDSADFEGRGWQNTEFPFDRIPSKVKDTLPEVYSLGHSSTGMCTFFDTDSSEILVRYKLDSEQLGENNFNMAAFSGFDLYIHDDNCWRWAGAAPHFAIKNTAPEYSLIDGMTGENHRCRLYAPLRNHLREVFVGIEHGASFAKVPPRKDKPLVYYGTSIAHGAYTIRPGLGVPQILGRNLDIPLINLGFSGAAKMEPEMAELLTELDAGIFIADPFHNMTSELIRQNAERFLDILCAAKPDTPVYFLSAPQTLKSWLRPQEMEEQQKKTELFHAIGRKMTGKHLNLHFIPGEDFYGSDDVSVDGLHPNDNAFANMANILTQKLLNYDKQ